MTRLLCLIILQKATDSALNCTSVNMTYLWFSPTKVTFTAAAWFRSVFLCVKSKAGANTCQSTGASHKERDFGRTVACAEPKHWFFGHDGLYKQLKLRQVDNFTKYKVATFITAIVHSGYQHKTFYNDLFSDFD